MPEQLYSTEMIQSLSRGNSELLRKLISLFVNQTPEFVREMHQAYKEKDFTTFKTLVHKIKPTYGYFGIKEIERDIQLIELLAEMCVTSDELELLLRKIERITNNVVVEMKSDFQLN
jgi:HPt (histidine-containing phosphotransfer) domain-containing protein